MFETLLFTLICTGSAPTTPKTNIEIEIRAVRFSTIRYEIAEGSLKGTAYIQSIGVMKPKRVGPIVEFYSGTAHLVLVTSADKIEAASFSHYSSGTLDVPMKCELSFDVSS